MLKSMWIYVIQFIVFVIVAFFHDADQEQVVCKSITLVNKPRDISRKCFLLCLNVAVFGWMHWSKKTKTQNQTVSYHVQWAMSLILSIIWCFDQVIEWLNVIVFVKYVCVCDICLEKPAYGRLCDDCDNYFFPQQFYFLVV